MNTLPSNKRLKLASAVGGSPSLKRPALTGGAMALAPCVWQGVARSLTAIR